MEELASWGSCISVVIQLRRSATYVLSGEGHDGRSVLRLDGDHVGGRRLVSVGRSPESEVGGSSQPSSGLYGLMGGSILSKTDRVVCSDIEDSEVGKSGKSDGTGGVGNKVQEGGDEWDDTTVCGETVGNGVHTVFTDTESEVSALVGSETGRWVLEVLGALPSGQVGSGQIGGTTDELGKDLGELVDGGLGELSRSDSGVRGRVGGESLLPSVGQSTLHSSSELGGLGSVLLGVLLEEVGPCGLGLGTLLGQVVVELVNLVWDNELLLGVEAKLLLELLDVVGLQRGTVNIVTTLLERTVTDNSLEVDHGWLVGRLLGLGDGGINGGEVIVTLLDVKNLPSVRLVSGLDILGERDGSVTINGDLVVVVDGNHVTELQVPAISASLCYYCKNSPGERAGLGSDTLLKTSISEETVGVVVEDLETVLVVNGAHVGLGDSETDGVGDTLSERTGGDLDTVSDTDLGVTRGDGVDLSEVLQVVHGQLVSTEVEQDVLENTSVCQPSVSRVKMKTYA